ncbi:hypothetical protein [Nocardia niwae]|uniref:hypothetical protein n=1 Tax=Nocardia niwae TaxID=626084 RepID=UPI0007A439E9|nr:hypothetical protein [Nocardia niwae]
MTTSDLWALPEQGEDEDYVAYLGRKSDFYEQNPPPAPPGFELIECDATPRHWPRYQFTDDDFYPAPCPDCVAQSYRKQADELKRRYHWLRHPIRGQFAAKVLGKLYSLGVVAGYGTTGGGPSGCRTCLVGINWRGRRPYILGWPDWKWRCLLKQRHWPGEQGYFGLCGKCVPCPDCGTTKVDHECPGETQ